VGPRSDVTLTGLEWHTITAERNYFFRKHDIGAGFLHHEGAAHLRDEAQWYWVYSMLT
jgi:hypothetical protein